MRGPDGETGSPSRRYNPALALISTPFSQKSGLSRYETSLSQ